MPERWAWMRADIGLRCWEDGCIAYQPLSGETHMLTAEAGRLLELLRPDGASTEALLASFGEDAADPALPEALHGWLQQLADARLIRQVLS